MLTDTFGRSHDYLRISLTDNCNMRCFYCMPEETISTLPHTHLMRAEEIEQIAGIFVKLGIKKIRLTGGEPLVRKEAAEIIERLSAFPVELTLTTNGIRADQFIPVFKKAGIRSVNVSLDTLKPDRFHNLTKRDQFQKVWDNIMLLVQEGFHVKLNVVVMDAVNNDELADFVELTRDIPLHVRFIEFMPFSGNHWKSTTVITKDHMLVELRKQFDFVPLIGDMHDTAKKFCVIGHQGTFATISTMSEPFCSGCNRLRLTADGKMKNCLFSKGETDLLTAFRNNGDLESLIVSNVLTKKKELGGQISGNFESVVAGEITNRSMIAIGG